MSKNADPKEAKADAKPTPEELIAQAEEHAKHLDNPNADHASKAIVAIVRLLSLAK